MPYKDNFKKLENAKRYREKYPERVLDAQRRSKAKKPEYYKNKTKQYNLDKRYNITIEEFENRIKIQKNLCACCYKPFEDAFELHPVVDHDHLSLKIRGILHRRCNLGIGQLGDNLQGLQQAVDYLIDSLIGDVK